MTRPLLESDAMHLIRVRSVSSESDWQAVKKLRLAVFVDEQGLPPDIEFDVYDVSATHAIVLDSDGVAVGTGRLYRDVKGEARIGRMAVCRDLRRSGIGGAVLEWLEASAAEQGAHEVVVHAQAYLERFYARRGYSLDGSPFEEDGIQHVRMTKTLPVDAKASDPAAALASIAEEE